MIRSWYSVLPSLDATISCGIKKAVVCVTQLMTALVSIHSPMTFLVDMYGFLDPPSRTVLFSVYDRSLFSVDCMNGLIFEIYNRLENTKPWPHQPKPPKGFQHWNVQKKRHFWPFLGVLQWQLSLNWLSVRRRMPQKFSAVGPFQHFGGTTPLVYAFGVPHFDFVVYQRTQLGLDAASITSSKITVTTT